MADGLSATVECACLVCAIAKDLSALIEGLIESFGPNSMSEITKEIDLAMKEIGLITGSSK